MFVAHTNGSRRFEWGDIKQSAHHSICHIGMTFVLLFWFFALFCDTDFTCLLDFVS